ncbi:MAG: hypothetical protein WDA18_04110 [Candidatus Ratteibacteria bacterium]|jgi:hypothetical protein
MEKEIPFTAVRCDKKSHTTLIAVQPLKEGKVTIDKEVVLLSVFRSPSAEYIFSPLIPIQFPLRKIGPDALKRLFSIIKTALLPQKKSYSYITTCSANVFY